MSQEAGRTKGDDTVFTASKAQRWARGLAGVLAAAALGAATLPVTTARADTFGPDCSNMLLTVVWVLEGVSIGYSQSAAETDLCVLYASQGVQGPIVEGGQLAVTGVAATIPALDGQAGACQSDPGYQHLVGATILTSPFSVDMATPSSGPEVCVAGGPVALRIRLSAGVGGVPQAHFTPYSGDYPFPWPPPAWPTSGPSSTCGYQLLYVASPAGTLWLSDDWWWNGDLPGSVCVRYQGAVTVGGRLDEPFTVVGVWPPPCTVNVVTVDAPVQVSVTASAPGALPQDVCISVAGTTLAEQASSPTGLLGTNWSKDSDSLI